LRKKGKGNSSIQVIRLGDLGRDGRAECFTINFSCGQIIEIKRPFYTTGQK